MNLSIAICAILLFVTAVISAISACCATCQCCGAEPKSSNDVTEIKVTPERRSHRLNPELYDSNGSPLTQPVIHLPGTTCVHVEERRPTPQPPQPAYHYYQQPIAYQQPVAMRPIFRVQIPMPHVHVFRAHIRVGRTDPFGMLL